MSKSGSKCFICKRIKKCYPMYIEEHHLGNMCKECIKIARKARFLTPLKKILRIGK